MSSQFLVPSPDDFDTQRADRSLGLRRAARYYNELVAPGIGGAWKVRHLSWAVAGLLLRQQFGDKHSAVALAHGVEALGSKLQWSMLPLAEQTARTGLRGQRAFNRSQDIWSFRELSQRRYYVQVTHRQQVTRALPSDTGLGLSEGSSRFNGMQLSAPGSDLALALLNQPGVGRGPPRLQQTLRDWVQGTIKVEPGSERLASVLGPNSPSPGERQLVRGRLLSHVSPGSVVGPRDPKRRLRMVEFLDAEVGSSEGWSDLTELLRWLELQPGGAAHADDIRTAMAFDDMRAAAVFVLDTLGAMLQASGSFIKVEVGARNAKVQSALTGFRKQVVRYRRSTTHGKNGRADALAFASEAESATDDAALVAALVRRDGRILELSRDAVYRGPLFQTFADRRSALSRSEEALTDTEAEVDAPTGQPARLFQFIALWRDCHGEA